MVGPPKPKGIAMSHVQSPIYRPARRTKAELAIQVESLKRHVAKLENAAADRIQTEDALRMSEARLRAIMDHAPTEIFLVDREGRYVLVNKEFERRYGLTEKQVVGKTMGEFFPADITAEFSAQDRKTFETGRAMVKEQVIEYGGVVHTDLEIKFPIVDQTGETVGVGGIATDITDRKKAEVALQHAHDELERRVAERTAELAAAQRLAKIGNWRWSVGRDALISCSEEFAHIHGVGIDEIVELMKAQMMRVVHPEDRNRVQSEFKRFDEEGIDFEIEYRIVRPDGEVRHVLELGEAVRDAAGQAIEQVGTVQDVTELKHVEEALREAHDELEQRVEERTSELHEVLEALRESEHRYREIFEESPVGIWEEDWSEAKRFVDRLAKRGVKDFRRYFARRPERAKELHRLISITNTSRAILDLYGVADMAALRKLFPATAEPDDNLRGVIDTLCGFLEGTMEREYETRDIRADGTEIRAHMRAIMPPQRRHDWSRVIYAIDDVTERRRADEALQESEHRYRALFENAPVAIRVENLSDVMACIDAVGIDGDEEFAAFLDQNPSFVVECSEAIEVVDVNQAAMKLHGVDHPDVLRANVTRNLSSAAHETLKDALLAMHRGETSLEFETFVIRTDGSRRDVDAHWSVVPGHEEDYSRTLFISVDITERKRAETALRESEARLWSILSHSPATICLKDPEGRYLLVNKRFEELHGVTNEHVVGRTAHDLFPPEIADSFTVQDTDVVNTGLVIEREQRVLTADGICPFAEIKFPVLDPVGNRIAIGLIGVDVTERKRTEAALRESEAMLAKAQRIGELGFSIWDEKEDREVYCSRTGTEIFGVPEGTLCDDFEAFLEKVHPDDRARVEAAMERGCEDCTNFEMEYRAVRPDGTARNVVERTECEFDDEGKLARTVSTLQDITERKRVEDEMHRYQAELAHVSRLNMLGEMTAGLAHELNQPLAVISSYAQGCLSSIEDGKDAPETLTGALQQIVNQSARASEIIRRIRGFIRKDRRRKSRIDVNAVIGVAIELLKGEIGANGVAIHMDLAEPSPTAVVDDVELQQVIVNLARNSIEMMVSEGRKPRKLYIRTTAKTRSPGGGVGQVEVSVQDSGPGVPPEIRDHIFEPFFTTKPQGLGLGLSICRSILDRHDGNLWLGGDSGTGADFRFTLPLNAREGPSDF